MAPTRERTTRCVGRVGRAAPRPGAEAAACRTPVPTFTGNGAGRPLSSSPRGIPAPPALKGGRLVAREALTDTAHTPRPCSPPSPPTLPHSQVAASARAMATARPTSSGRHRLPRGLIAAGGRLGPGTAP